jgi:CHAD domain-containing protein
MELDYVKLKQIKPAITGYIRKSQVLLKRSGIPDENAVHDIRVLMKKSRALLKLAAPQLDKTYLDKNMAELREVGKIMCNWRETSVQRKIIKELKKENADLFSVHSENRVLTFLLEHQKTSNEFIEDATKTVEQIDSLLNKTGFRIRFESMNMIDPKLLIKELENSYYEISDLYLVCRNNPKPLKLHKLRRKSKDFLYQLLIFRPLNPAVIKALEKKLDRMTQDLGKFNDLAQLIKSSGYYYRMDDNDPAVDELIVKLREKQDKYMSKVWPVAYKIFCPGQNLINILGFKLLVI